MAKKRTESCPGMKGPKALTVNKMGRAVREIRMLRATWRGLETWHGRDASANWRASPRPYREGRSSFFNRAAGVKKVVPFRFQENRCQHAGGMPLAKYRSHAAVSSSGLSRSACKRHLCGI